MAPPGGGKERDTAEVRCAVTAATLAPEDLTRLKAELIQVVREELTARGEARVVDDGARVPAPEPSAQSLVAQQESYQVIDAAARARRWTNEDRDALRRAFVEMAPNQRIEVMRRFSTSLNGKKIDLQTQGAPF